MKLEKLQKLLALANSQPDEPEGQSARKMADKYLAKLGLTEEDIATQEVVVLPDNRKLWEEALIEVVTTVHPVDLIQRTEKDKHGNVLVIKGAGADVKLVDYRFTTLRRAVLMLSGDYERSLRMVIDPSKMAPITEIFRNYVVIALSERMLSDEIEDQELQQIEQEEGLIDEDDQVQVDELLGADETDEEVDADGFFDKLLDRTTSQADDDFPGLGRLDPCIAGYQAGMRIPLQDAIPCESDVTIEEARQITRRPDRITQDHTNGLNHLEGVETPDWDW